MNKKINSVKNEMQGVHKKLMLACAVASFLTACGGSGGGGGGVAESSGASVSGVAATGAPIPGGTVSLKDAGGTTKTGTTRLDGSYSIDVTGLTAPFLLEVNGVVGGDRVFLHSVAERAPAAGSSVVANITPLSDSIVANIAGGDPVAFYSSPDNSRVTSTSIQAAQTALRNALASLMTAAGLPSDVDFLKTPFVANKTGMDAVLESVRVSVSVANSQPVTKIVNKFNQSEVVSLTGSGTATQTGTITQATLPDISGMDAVAGRFTSAIASSSAMSSLLPAMFDAAFMDSGEDRTAALGNLQNEATLIGAKLGLPAVVSCNSVGDTCEVKMTLTYTNGDVESFRQVLKKQGNGSWNFFGNQYHHDSEIKAVAQRFIRTDGVASPGTESGLQVYINPAIGNVGSAIVYVQSPSGGADKELIKLSKKSASCGVNASWLSVDHAGNCSNFYPLSDLEIDQIVTANDPNPKFRIQLFTDEAYTTAAGAEGNGRYSNLHLESLPLKSAQLATAPFPTLTQSALTNLAAFGVSGPLDLSWTASRAAPVESVTVRLSDTNVVRSLNAESVIGLSQFTLRGNDTTGTTTASAYRSVYLSAQDNYGRSFWTKYYGCGGGTCF